MYSLVREVTEVTEMSSHTGERNAMADKKYKKRTQSFAEKVEELLIDNNLNYKMGQEGLKKAKLISWTQMTIQMNSFFEKTIN